MYLVLVGIHLINQLEKLNILLDSKLQDTLSAWGCAFFSTFPPFRSFLHGSSGSAPVAVETQIWVQMQWQRRWSIWAIFALASGLKRDEIQPTATWRHGRVNFNSYCIFIHQNFENIILGKGGGDKHQKLHEKNLNFFSIIEWCRVFSCCQKKSFEQFPMSQPLTPFIWKRSWALKLSWGCDTYYWVDDHPLLYGNNGSLDPGTYEKYHQWWFSDGVFTSWRKIPADFFVMIPDIRGWFQHAASSLQRKCGTGRSARNLPLFVGWTTRWVPLLVINGVYGARPYI